MNTWLGGMFGMPVRGLLEFLFYIQNQIQSRIYKIQCVCYYNENHLGDFSLLNALFSLKMPFEMPGVWLAFFGKTRFSVQHNILIISVLFIVRYICMHVWAVWRSFLLYLEGVLIWVGSFLYNKSYKIFYKLSLK